MSVGIFFVGTSFLLKGFLGGFDCTRDRANGKLYLDIDPGIECYTDDHTTIRLKAVLGLVMWCAIMGRICLTFLGENGKYKYSFLTTKLEDKWYWWELFLLARKTLIMACGLFNTSETSRGLCKFTSKPPSLVMYGPILTVCSRLQTRHRFRGRPEHDLKRRMKMEADAQEELNEQV
jgi:hypothetical protein